MKQELSRGEFWDRNYDAFCEREIPIEEREKIINKAWSFALSATLIVIGILFYLNF